MDAVPSCLSVAKPVSARHRYLRRCGVIWGGCDALFTPHVLEPIHDMAHALGSEIGKQLLEGAEDVFGSPSERGRELSDEELKALHAKIGQQELEIDFLSGALGRIDGTSAKR